jgi:arsenate reductase (thioredoxin)
MYLNLSKKIIEISSLSVSKQRKEILQPLIAFIQEKVNQSSEIRLNFICTHNSRRSHLAQVWAQTMAFHFHVKNVFCYSGGTEATAMFTKVGETLVNQGFQMQQFSTSDNPVYGLKFDENQHPIICFSKRFDDAFNPNTQFAAIMTCSAADSGCPFIPGAEKRIPITFDDPKAFDGTDVMNEKYAERSLEIASELLYVFSQISNN